MYANLLRNIRAKQWFSLPIYGSILFILLYLLAAYLYPGGSQHDAQAKGFSWLHNYWCNLLNKNAINGELNKGQPFALLASLVLSISLLSFWLICGARLKLSPLQKRTLHLSSVVCIISLFFLSTGWHDSATNIAGFFGLIAMAIVYSGLYKNGWHNLFLFGLFNVLLVVVNNYLYYTRGLLYYLPLVQKITFMSCLIWICFVSVKMYRD